MNSLKKIIVAKDDPFWRTWGSPSGGRLLSCTGMHMLRCWAISWTGLQSRLNIAKDWKWPRSSYIRTANLAKNKGSVLFYLLHHCNKFSFLVFFRQIAAGDPSSAKFFLSFPSIFNVFLLPIRSSQLHWIKELDHF